MQISEVLLYTECSLSQQCTHLIVNPSLIRSASGMKLLETVTTDVEAKLRFQVPVLLRGITVLIPSPREPRSNRSNTEEAGALLAGYISINACQGQESCDYHVIRH